MGCGYKVCPIIHNFGSGPWLLVVCNYSPPGNWNGLRPYVHTSGGGGGGGSPPPCNNTCPTGACGSHTICGATVECSSCDFGEYCDGTGTCAACENPCSAGQCGSLPSPSCPSVFFPCECSSGEVCSNNRSLFFFATFSFFLPSIPSSFYSLLLFPPSTLSSCFLPSSLYSLYSLPLFLPSTLSVPPFPSTCLTGFHFNVLSCFHVPSRNMQDPSPPLPLLSFSKFLHFNFRFISKFLFVNKPGHYYHIVSVKATNICPSPDIFPFPSLHPFPFFK